MRDLLINQSTIYYAMYVGKKEILDKRGNGTGNYKSVYTKPRPFDVAVSINTGATESNPFGAFTDYDKALSTVSDDFHADEYSILWIDTLPVLDENGDTETPHDYVVSKVAKWKNQKNYAVSKVVNNLEDADYRLHLLETGAITQEEYDYYSLLDEDDDE